MLNLKDLQFTDLFLQHDIENSRIRGYENSSDLKPIPVDVLDEVRRLYKTTDSTFRQSNESSEFSVPFDDTIYRVTVIPDIRQRVFALRRGSIFVPEISECGIPPVVLAKILESSKGLILFSGAFGAGKTTAASAFVIAKTKKGGLAITLEDPPELAISGDHGNGRCLQVAVDRENIEKIIQTTMRMSFDLLFVSEARTPKLAAELINASVNGKLVVSTIHSEGVVSAIERLAAIAGGSIGAGGAGSPQNKIYRDMLSAGLTAVIHMEKVTQNKRTASEFLIGKSDEVRAKIAEGEFRSLQNTVTMQKNRIMNNMKID